MPVCEIDLRPGGTWHFVWRKADGERDGDDRRLPGGRAARAARSDRVLGRRLARDANTVVFTEEPDGTTRSRRTIVYPSKEARDAAMATGMQEGADQSFDRLEQYLETVS